MKKINLTFFIFLLSVMIFIQCEDESDNEPDFETPVAAFNMNAETVYSGQPLMFINTSTGDYNIVNWTFEGGNPAVSQEKDSVIVTFEQEGSYKVKLEIAYKTEVSDIVKTIQVEKFVYEPVADFEADKIAIAPGETIQFTNKSQHADSYQWTFEGGDPASSSDENPGVTFNEVGEYTVSLKVSNEKGEDTKELAISVTSNIVVDFTLSADTIEVGNTISITDKSVGDITSYDWTIEGGEPASASTQSVDVTFNNTGEYTIILKVNGDENLIVSKQVVVQEKQAAPEDVGLIAYWPFDGDATDKSGNGLDGELQGDASFIEDHNGNADGAVYLDGDGDFVICPNHAYFKNNFSVSVRVRWDELRRFERIWDFGDRSNVNVVVCGQQQETGKLFMNGITETEKKGPGLFSKWTIKEGTWMHLVITYTASEEKMVLYVDGKEVDSHTEMYPPNGSELFDCWIGRSAWFEYKNDDLMGAVDEFRIYDHVISKEVIDILYSEY